MKKTIIVLVIITIFAMMAVPSIKSEGIKVDTPEITSFVDEDYIDDIPFDTKAIFDTLVN